MKRNHSGKVRRKRVRSRIRWAMVLVLVLAMGLLAEYVRLELGAGAVTVTAPFRPQYSANEDPGSSIDLAKNLCGITAFAERSGTTGAGQKIAVIDSGIDLAHEAFGDNHDGSRKVAAFYDYTDEGLLYTEAAQQQGDKVSLGGTLYQIGSIYNQADVFYMSFLDLTDLEPQMLDGAACEMAILLTATGIERDGCAYDCIYIDTNQNCDFTDEEPLYCYADRGRYLTIQHAGYPMTIAVTEIAPDGRRIHLSTDTLGHGTFLASVIAANGEAYQGVAPQAQLYVYKIFDALGASGQQKLAKAIEQAIQDDVDCINLSLSIPKHELILPALSAALRMAQKADIPVIAAAGNYGPGKDTLAYPAREADVIGVGSVACPEQYRLDRTIYLEDCFIPDYSGRGSVDGSTAPLLVAPSGVIAAVPLWCRESYMYDYGTSISAAIVTGAVCHLQERAARGSMAGEPSLTSAEIRSVLAQWAQDLHFASCEQGYGAFSMGMPEADLVSAALPKLSAERVELSAPDFVQQFIIPQGQVQSWYIDVPEDTRLLEISFAVQSEAAGDWPGHRIAMGRCCMYVYRPDGTLAETTGYIGAAYGAEQKTKESSLFRYPQAGTWEVVIASADNLSVYQHFETIGMLHVSAK